MGKNGELLFHSRPAAEDAIAREPGCSVKLLAEADHSKGLFTAWGLAAAAAAPPTNALVSAPPSSADFLTPKAIANRIKAKGLQKLRWYCQVGLWRGWASRQACA